MRKYSPANFTDVRLTGAFWRERLDTVLARSGSQPVSPA